MAFKNLCCKTSVLCFFLWTPHKPWELGHLFLFSFSSFQVSVCVVWGAFGSQASSAATAGKKEEKQQQKNQHQSRKKERSWVNKPCFEIIKFFPSALEIMWQTSCYFLPSFDYFLVKWWQKNKYKVMKKITKLWNIDWRKKWQRNGPRNCGPSGNSAPCLCCLELNSTRRNV